MNFGSQLNLNVTYNASIFYFISLFIFWIREILWLTYGKMELFLISTKINYINIF